MFAVLDGVREDVRVVTLAFDVVVVGDDVEENGLVADVFFEGVERVVDAVVDGVADVIVGVDVEEGGNEEEGAINEDERLETAFEALAMRGIFLCFFFCDALALGKSWKMNASASSSCDSSVSVSASKEFVLMKLVPGAGVTAAMKPP